ncbi:MAG TPA: ABC transporter permease, partial [Armatimonadota bacterium]|nr:ABC transporter permease [Armatimonadota bacterium]
MPTHKHHGFFARFMADYGIVLALVLLCVYFSVVTYTEQKPVGAAGGAQLAAEVIRALPREARVLAVVRDSREDAAFAEALSTALTRSGRPAPETVEGAPADARRALERIARDGGRLDAIACTPATATWAVFDRLETRHPTLAGARVMAPQGYQGSNFLKPDNLLNVANQIAVIAIVAIGMTLVIITGGIDLSVGSLIALSAVVSTLLIQDYAGAERAGTLGMVAGCAAGIAVCGMIGLFSGTMVTLFRIPAFIVTLAMMLVASGLAFTIARGESVYQIPESFVWLGRGADLGIPRAVWLMLGLYLVAHFLMMRSRPGRYVYASGSNAEAARLSGIPVGRTLVWVYTLSGLLAGLGGVVMASQLKSGAPTYGQMYELYVIAAVVVGGTSLAGGEGRVFGTLIGAFIIAVIRNGMNLTGVGSYTQQIILGLVILGAVMLDMVKR